MANMTANQERFTTALATAYAQLFTTAEYAFAAARHTPESLAARMAAGLADNSANHDGAGIRAACKAVGIPHTRKAIRAFLLT
jgi:hypothetical protein